MSFLMHHKYGPRICVIICLGLIYLLSACSTPELKVVKEYHPVLVEVPSPLDRKSTRLNSSHSAKSRMPSSA